MQIEEEVVNRKRKNVQRLLSATKTKHQVESRLLLDIVVGQSATVLQLLTSEDETLLVRGDTLLILNLGLDVVDRVRGLDFERDGLAGERLDEDLHTTAQAEDEVEGGFLLDVVVGKGATVFELLASENETLLVRRNALLVLDLALYVVDGIGGLDLQGDSLASESLDEDLHTTAQTQDKVEGGFLLDVVVGKGATVFELLASEDQALLVRGDALLILDLGLDIIDGVGGLDLKSDGLASQSLNDYSGVSRGIMDWR